VAPGHGVSGRLVRAGDCRRDLCPGRWVDLPTAAGACTGRTATARGTARP
jgi:hypothetical protein